MLKQHVFFATVPVHTHLLVLGAAFLVLAPPMASSQKPAEVRFCGLPHAPSAAQCEAWAAPLHTAAVRSGRLAVGEACLQTRNRVDHEQVLLEGTVKGDWTKSLSRTTSFSTVNVDIFAQYIFSHMVSDALKKDVSENINHYRLDGIRY